MKEYIVWPGEVMINVADWPTSIYTLEMAIEAETPEDAIECWWIRERNVPKVLSKVGSTVIDWNWPHGELPVITVVDVKTRAETTYLARLVFDVVNEDPAGLRSETQGGEA